MRGSTILKKLRSLGITEEVFAMLARRRGCTGPALQTDFDESTQILLALDAREWERLTYLPGEGGEREIQKFADARPQGAALALLKLHIPTPISDLDLLALLQRRGVKTDGDLVPASMIDASLMGELQADAQALADITDAKARQSFLDFVPECETLRTLCQRLSHPEEKPLPDAVMGQLCKQTGVRVLKNDIVARRELWRHGSLFPLQQAIRHHRQKTVAGRG